MPCARVLMLMLVLVLNVRCEALSCERKFAEYLATSAAGMYIHGHVRVRFLRLISLSLSFFFDVCLFVLLLLYVLCEGASELACLRDVCMRVASDVCMYALQCAKALISHM